MGFFLRCYSSSLSDLVMISLPLHFIHVITHTTWQWVIQKFYQYQSSPRKSVICIPYRTNVAPNIDTSQIITFFLLNEPHMEQLMLFYTNNSLIYFLINRKTLYNTRTSVLLISLFISICLLFMTAHNQLYRLNMNYL